MAYRVYLFAGSHPVYRSLVEFPPDNNFEVVSNIPPEAFINDRLSVYSPMKNRIRRVGVALSRLLGLPRVFLPPPGYDLIHSCRGFIPLTKTPSVIDFECVTSFANMDPVALQSARRMVLRLLSRPAIKYILPHSYAAARSVESVFGNAFSEKMRVVYPAAVPSPCVAHPGSRETFTILFVGKNFRIKGGVELYRAYKLLSREYKHMKLVIKSNPDEIPRKIVSDPGVHVITKILPYQEVLRLYCSADVFVLPTYMDTFGYVFLEAMAAGLPVIGTDVFAVPEIIQNGYNGFVIHSDIRWHDDRYLPRKEGLRFGSCAEEHIVNQLVDKIRMLIEDKSLLQEMSQNAIYLVTEGKFSIKFRNEVLREIYMSAVSG